MTTARIMLHRHNTEPTDRSMPPVMITIVMPSATTATKVKLRVTLKRLFEVANELVAKERKMLATTTASSTQNACRDASHDTSENRPRLTPSSNWMSMLDTFGFLEPKVHYSACSMAPVINPVTSSGELEATSLSATLRPRRSTTTRLAIENTSGMRWLIRTIA